MVFGMDRMLDRNWAELGEYVIWCGYGRRGREVGVDGVDMNNMDMDNMNMKRMGVTLAWEW